MATGVNIPSMQDEIEDAVVYARSYLGIETTDHRKVWYHLFVQIQQGGQMFCYYAN